MTPQEDADRKAINDARAELHARLHGKLGRAQAIRTGRVRAVQRALMYVAGSARRLSKYKYMGQMIKWQRRIDQSDLTRRLHQLRATNRSLGEGRNGTHMSARDMFVDDMLKREHRALVDKCPFSNPDYKQVVEAVNCSDTLIYQTTHNIAARAMSEEDVTMAIERLRQLRLDPEVASVADTDLFCEEEIGQYAPDIEGYDSELTHLCEQYCEVGQTGLVCPKNTPQRVEDPARAPIKIEAEILESSDSDTESDAE